MFVSLEFCYDIWDAWKFPLRNFMVLDSCKSWFLHDNLHTRIISHKKKRATFTAVQKMAVSLWENFDFLSKSCVFQHFGFHLFFCIRWKYCKGYKIKNCSSKKNLKRRGAAPAPVTLFVYLCVLQIEPSLCCKLSLLPPVLTSTVGVTRSFSFKHHRGATPWNHASSMKNWCLGGALERQMTLYGWWFNQKSGGNAPVEVCSLFHYLRGLYIPDFLPSTVVDSKLDTSSTALRNNKFPLKIDGWKMIHFL